MIKLGLYYSTFYVSKDDPLIERFWTNDSVINKIIESLQGEFYKREIILYKKQECIIMEVFKDTIALTLLSCNSKAYIKIKNN